MNKTVSVDWAPDKKSKIPLYQQIVDYCSMKISRGDWSVGYRLPSQREMAEQFNVNRSTLLMAMDIMKNYGIIETCVGSGTVIAGNTWSIMASNKDLGSNWSSYVANGYFKENLPTIQEINKLEFEEGIIRLGTGEMGSQLLPQEAILKSIENLSSKVGDLGYLGPLGLDSLRVTLSHRLQNIGIYAKPSNILITSGSLQAFQLISISMLSSNMKVYCEIPSYINSLQVFQSAGMVLEGVPMDEEGLQYWNIRKEKGNAKSSLVYTIPTFHNPTGTLMSEERRRELYRFCRENAMPIIEDDAYCELYHGEKPPKPIKSFDDSGSVLYVGTASKSFAPGLRVGWIVGPEPIVERMGDVKMQVDYGASSLSQLVLNEALQNGSYDRFLEDFRKKLTRRKAKMAEALEEHFKELARWNEPEGGYYIWLDFIKKVPVDKLFRAALQNHLLLNTGNVYHKSKDNSLRLSFAYIEEEQIEPAIRLLSSVVKKILK